MTDSEHPFAFLPVWVEKQARQKRYSRRVLEDLIVAFLYQMGFEKEELDKPLQLLMLDFAERAGLMAPQPRPPASQLVAEYFEAHPLPPALVQEARIQFRQALIRGANEGEKEALLARLAQSEGSFQQRADPAENQVKSGPLAQFTAPENLSKNKKPRR